LTEIPGVKIFSFQRGVAPGELPELPLVRLDWRDVIEEAGMLLAIDLLVSVDTMPAHLAGALGVPVWLLLHTDPDWRWMEERDDSPWYPSMRLFRQRRPGDWKPVLQRVAEELCAMRLQRLKPRTIVPKNGTS
jgi:ADP-heptose:LPS heptosyltransferase